MPVEEEEDEDDEDLDSDEENIDGDEEDNSISNRKLMGEILLSAFLPRMIEGRLSDEEKCALCYDGDRPQIEASYGPVIIHITSNNLPVELLKLPAGCSLIFQPNDQMRSHAIIHRMVKTVPTLDITKLSSPYWLPQLENLLNENRISSASKKTFIKFFMYLPDIISNAFKKNIVESGWKSTGLFPLNYVRILAQSPGWSDRDLASVHQIMSAVSALVEKYGIEETFITDEMIQTELQDDYKLRTKIINPDLMNHARAVWLNSKVAIQKRREEIQRRREKAAPEELNASKQQRKQQNKQIDKEVERVGSQEEFQLASFPFSKHSRISCFKHGCKNERQETTQDTDDGWKKCPIEACNNFFCPNISCQSFGSKHKQQHLSQKTKDENFHKKNQPILTKNR